MGLIVGFAVTAVTSIHTAEEAAQAIWDSIGVPKWLYFGFQAFVLTLGILVVAAPPWLWAEAFVFVRLFDVIVTHLWFKHPGEWSAALLLADAALVAHFYL